MLEFGVKRVGKKWIGVSTVFVIGLLALTFNQPWNRVVEVLDGDTFRMANGQRVRLLAVDAPELEFCGGTEAKNELEKLTIGKKAKLSEITTDGYGRIVALVSVENNNINEKMVSSGWGLWDGTKQRVGGKMGKISQTARDNKTGVWGNCRATDNKICLIKGNIEKNNEKGKPAKRQYFFPGCSEYERTVVERDLGENWFCTEEEAQAAGYTKGTNCYGKRWKD